MKTTTRLMLACILVLFGSSAWPFSDGFEAHAAPKCTPATTLDLKDGLKPVLLQGEVCTDAGKATAPCQRDTLGVCKREASPLPPIPPTQVCNVTQHGYSGHRLTWEQLFYGAPFPTGPSYLAPIGAYTLRAMAKSTRGLSMAKRYFYTPFVAEPGKMFTLSWLQAQPVPLAGRDRDFPNGYNPARTGTPLVTVSECPGDLRPHNVFSTDPSIRYCRAALQSGKLTFGGANAVCKLTAGKTYYINIAFIDTRAGYPATTTCASGDRCEANFSAR